MDEVWDVAIVGGGAAGMMAAGVAAARGAHVVLIEKNRGLGKKLLITGGGRCNVTNAELDTRTLLAKFNTKQRKNDHFLFSAFAAHGVLDSLAFFNDRGMPTKIEALKRVFPVSDKAESVWDVLVTYLQQGDVHVITGTNVTSVDASEGRITKVVLANGQKIRAHSYILATGGKSRPETGSTGDGFTWLRALGHTVREPSAALVPLSLKNPWIHDVSGLSLEQIRLTLTQHGKKYGTTSGSMLFTHVGASGPAILNMSRDVSELIKYDAVTILLDLVPTITQDALNTALHELLRTEANKKVKNVLGMYGPSSLISVVLFEAGIPEDTPCHSVTREQRLALMRTLKGIPLHVKGILGTEKAIVTSGGVSPTEVDWKTMRSRLVENLYIVGDLLDIDRPSGGYSLQLCWTTGTVAGNAVSEKELENT